MSGLEVRVRLRRTEIHVSRVHSKIQLGIFSKRMVVVACVVGNLALWTNTTEMLLL
jgi:hypothetical protein